MEIQKITIEMTDEDRKAFEALLCKCDWGCLPLDEEGGYLNNEPKVYFNFEGKGSLVDASVFWHMLCKILSAVVGWDVEEPLDTDEPDTAETETSNHQPSTN